MKAIYLALTIALTTGVSASASEPVFDADLLSSFSSFSAQSKADLNDCLSDDSSSKAVRACTKTIRASAPNDGVRAHLYTRRALHRMALGRFDDASEDFARAGDLKGDADLASVGEGFVAMMDQDLTTARAKFESSTQADTVAPLAAYGLGLTHQMAGETRQAREAYQQALTLRPGWAAVSEQMDTLGDK